MYAARTSRSAAALALLVASAACSTGARHVPTGPSEVAPDCVGPAPAASAWGATPGLFPYAGSDAGVQADDLPRFALNDFQPRSCGYGATYGLEPSRGEATVVALLASW